MPTHNMPYANCFRLFMAFYLKLESDYIVNLLCLIEIVHMNSCTSNKNETLGKSKRNKKFTIEKTW